MLVALRSAHSNAMGRIALPAACAFQPALKAAKGTPMP